MWKLNFSCYVVTQKPSKYICDYVHVVIWSLHTNEFLRKLIKWFHVVVSRQSLEIHTILISVLTFLAYAPSLSVSASLSLFLSLSVCLSHSLSLYVSISVCLSLSVCLTLCLSCSLSERIFKVYFCQMVWCECGVDKQNVLLSCSWNCSLIHGTQNVL